MLSMYRWLQVFAVFLVIAIGYAMSYQRRKRLPKRIISLLPPKDIPKKELPDYLNQMLGRKVDLVKVTTQELQSVNPLPLLSLTMEGASVGATSGTIIPLDPQMKQYEWALLPEEFNSIQEEAPVTKSESALPTPIDIRKKYTLTRGETF